jgi:hypothetical protein
MDESETFFIEMRLFLIEWIKSVRKEDQKGFSGSFEGTFSLDSGGVVSAG